MSLFTSFCSFVDPTILYRILQAHVVRCRHFISTILFVIKQKCLIEVILNSIYNVLFKQHFSLIHKPSQEGFT